jgi:hypothetical protein
MFTRKIESSTNVIGALDFFYQRSPREKFLRDLENDIRRATGVARIEGLKLYARVTGLDVSAPEKPKFSVGDVVIVDGQRRCVLAVDSNGFPTEASDEIIP